MRRNRLIALGIFGVALTGCNAHFKETYYVGVYEKRDGRRELAQFYRFRLKGNAFLSDSRFEAGWFDAVAAERLFTGGGDRTILSGLLPADAAGPPNGGSTTGKAAAADPSSATHPSAEGGNVESKAAAAQAPETSNANSDKSKVRSAKTDAPYEIAYHFGPEGVAPLRVDANRLVMIMHADPKAITGRLSELTSQEATSDLLMSLVRSRGLASHQAAIGRTQADLAAEKSLAQFLADTYGSATGEGIKDKPAPKDVVQAIRDRLADQR